ncbi:hypothetical protein CP533_4089 [Ophiocordyceps camponoti-saundersi (nom. inval.)]|nr:hypothetical protein CP533_4089 [Ophiocordyceps camponoti-saundersi (nom. inval.)]
MLLMRNIALLFIALYLGMVTAPRTPLPPGFDPRATAVDVLEGRMSRNFLVEMIKSGLREFSSSHDHHQRRAWAFSPSGMLGRPYRSPPRQWTTASLAPDPGRLCRRSGGACNLRNTFEWVIKKGFKVGVRKAGSMWTTIAVEWVKKVALKLVPEVRIAHVAFEIISLVVVDVYKGWHRVKLVDAPTRYRSAKSRRIPPTAHEQTLMDHAQDFGIWWGIRTLREVEALLTEVREGRGPVTRAKMAKIGRPVTRKDIDEIKALAYVDEDDDVEYGYQADEAAKPEPSPVEQLLIACASRDQLVREDAMEICDILSGGMTWLDNDYGYGMPSEVIECKGIEISAAGWAKIARGEIECKLPGGPDELTMRWYRGETLQKCKQEDGNKWCTNWTPTKDWLDPNYGLPSIAIAEAGLFGIPSLPPDPRRRGRPLGLDIYNPNVGEVKFTDEMTTLWLMALFACGDPVYQQFCEVQRVIMGYIGFEYDESQVSDRLRVFYSFVFPRTTDAELPWRLEEYQQLLLQGVICEQVHLALDADHDIELDEYVRDIHGRCNQQFHDNAPNVATYGLQLWSAMRIMAEYIKGGWMDHFQCSIRRFNRLTIIPKGNIPDIEIQCLGGNDPNQIIADMDLCGKQEGYSWNLAKSRCEEEAIDKAKLFTALDGSIWTRTGDGLKRCSTWLDADQQHLSCSLVDPERLTEREQRMVLTSGVPLEDDERRQKSWKDVQGTTWAWRNGSLEMCDEANKCMLFKYPQFPGREVQRASQAGVPGLQGVQDADLSAVSCDGFWDPPQLLTEMTINGTIKCGVALDYWWWEDKCFLNNCVWDFTEILCTQHHPYHMYPSRYRSAEYAGVLPLESQRDWMERCDELASLHWPSTPGPVDKTKELAKDKMVDHCEDSSGAKTECGGGLTWDAYLRVKRECNGFWNRATARCLPMKRRDPEILTNFHVDGLRRIFKCPKFGNDFTCTWNYMTVQQGRIGWGGIYNPTHAMLKRWKEWTE